MQIISHMQQVCTKRSGITIIASNKRELTTETWLPATRPCNNGHKQTDVNFISTDAMGHRDLHDKLIIARLAYKMRTFHETTRFVAVFTRDRHQSLSCAT
jgi:hypothetical protein